MGAGGGVSAADDRLVKAYKVIWRKDGLPWDTWARDELKTALNDLDPVEDDVGALGVGPAGFERRVARAFRLHPFNLRDVQRGFDGNLGGSVDCGGPMSKIIIECKNRSDPLHKGVVGESKSAWADMAHVFDEDWTKCIVSREGFHPTAKEHADKHRICLFRLVVLDRKDELVWANDLAREFRFRTHGRQRQMQVEALCEELKAHGDEDAEKKARAKELDKLAAEHIAALVAKDLAEKQAEAAAAKAEAEAEAEVAEAAAKAANGSNKRAKVKCPICGRSFAQNLDNSVRRHFCECPKCKKPCMPQHKCVDCPVCGCKNVTTTDQTMDEHIYEGTIGMICKGPPTV